ncbi:MAG: hypothetical protein LC676_10920 [Loktanella sp.]|nr:hypothetical protein [Loktanella sp.]
MDDIKLDRLAEHETPLPPQFPRDKFVRCGGGRIGPLQFIYHEEEDGQIEISLSCPGSGEKPKNWMVNQFMRHINAKPFAEADIPKKRQRHFVIRLGRNKMQ